MVARPLRHVSASVVGIGCFRPENQMGIIGAILDFLLGVRMIKNEDAAVILDDIEARFSECIDAIKDRADFDGDGYINVRELLELLNHVLKGLRAVFRDMVRTLG